MNDRVGKVLEHLDRPVRPRREFEDALLRSCLVSLAGEQPLPATENSAAAVVGAAGPGVAGPARRTGAVGRWTRWGHRSPRGRLREVMVGVGTAALLSGLLGASLLLGPRGQVGPSHGVPGSASRTATQEPVARYADLLRADYPTIAADVERIGVRCAFSPSADLQQCRTYVLELRTAAQRMRDDLGALAVNDTAIRRDLDDLVTAANLQLSNIAAGRFHCCLVDDAAGPLHDDVFAALGVAPPGGIPTG